MEYRQRSVQCAGPAGLHRMAYTEWGDPRNSRVLICVHALTRNCRDFDFLARALASHYRVVCPDIAGRGLSDWLKDPAGYAIPNYVADVVTLIARLDVETVDWVGISMGGLIGMALASMDKTPVRRLVVQETRLLSILVWCRYETNQPTPPDGYHRLAWGYYPTESHPCL